MNGCPEAASDGSHRAAHSSKRRGRCRNPDAPGGAQSVSPRSPPSAWTTGEMCVRVPAPSSG